MAKLRQQQGTLTPRFSPWPMVVYGRRGSRLTALTNERFWFCYSSSSPALCRVYEEPIMSLSPALKQAVAQSRLKFKNNGVEAYEYSEIGIADQTFRDAYRDGYRDGYCCAQAQRRTLIAPVES